MKVLVCGSRTWGELPDNPTRDDFMKAEAEMQRLVDVLDEEHANQPFTVVIEGEAPGADTLARKWAQLERIQVAQFPADWKKYGRAAGPIRNRQMLVEGQPDFVIAFTNDLETSRGTRNMVIQARNEDIPVRVVGVE